jgi:hypothetical protein
MILENYTGEFTGKRDADGKDIYNGSLLAVPDQNKAGKNEFARVCRYKTGGYGLDGMEITLDELDLDKVYIAVAVTMKDYENIKSKQEELVNRLDKLAASKLDDEALQSNMEDGWGGNYDDAFQGGCDYGEACLAERLLEDYFKSAEGTSKQ